MRGKEKLSFKKEFMAWEQVKQLMFNMQLSITQEKIY
jgi:hypothetical protein